MNGDAKGFTLVEILVGITIFMFGMLGVVALLTASVRDNAFSGNLSEASMLAASKLEVLMARAYTDSDLVDTDGDGGGGISDADCGPADGCPTAADGMNAAQGKNGIYTVYWNIEDNSPMASCKKINVIVRWNDRDNARQMTVCGYRTGGM